MTHSQQDVLNEIMRLSRFGYQPQPWMYSSLLRPSKPSKPTTLPTTEIVRTPAYEAPVAPEQPAEFEVVPVWQALLDVRVWRTRPWWWRLVGSIVVRRRSLSR